MWTVEWKICRSRYFSVIFRTELRHFSISNMISKRWLQNRRITLQRYICCSLAGRSVLGETVLEVLSTALGCGPRAVLRPRAQFLPIRTNLGGWTIFLFFSYRDLKVSGKFSFTLQRMCVEVGRVPCWWSARSIANQNKLKITTFLAQSVMYIMALTALF